MHVGDTRVQHYLRPFLNGVLGTAPNLPHWVLLCLPVVSLVLGLESFKSYLPENIFLKPELAFKTEGYNWEGEVC